MSASANFEKKHCEQNNTIQIDASNSKWQSKLYAKTRKKKFSKQYWLPIVIIAFFAVLN